MLRLRSPIAISPNTPHTRMSKSPYMSQSWVTLLVTSDNFHKQSGWDLWVQLLVPLSWVEFANQDLMDLINQSFVLPMRWWNSTNTTGYAWRHLEGLPGSPLLVKKSFGGNPKQQVRADCAPSKSKGRKNNAAVTVWVLKYVSLHANLVMIFFPPEYSGF